MRINTNTQISLNSYSGQNNLASKSDLRSQDKSSIDNNAVKVSISSTSLNKLDKISDNSSLKNETIIQYRNEYNVFKDRKAQLREIRNDYYSKEVEDSKKFHSPIHHIRDKYINADSSYFRDDLTDSERKTAYFNESEYLEYGDSAGYFYEARIFSGIVTNGRVEDSRTKEFNREKVNEQFGQLLNKYNITIPENLKLNFSIDPYKFKVEVSGTDDKNLINKVENAINTAENSMNLFYHISNSEWENNTQKSSEKSLKKSIYDDIKRETGYELDKLDVVNGKFVTKDGTDIFELTKKNIKEGTTIVPKEFQSYVIADIHEKLENLAKVGFDGVPDLILSIDYENGSFYDIGQSKNFGEGQTEWIDELEEKYSAESYKKGYRTPSTSSSQELSRFDKIGIIKEALQEILNSKEDDKFSIDDDKKIFDKDELLIKYLFETWKESEPDDFNTFLEELKKDGVIDQQFLSDANNQRDSKIQIQNSHWINELKESKQSVHIYV